MCCCLALSLWACLHYAASIKLAWHTHTLLRAGPEGRAAGGPQGARSPPAAGSRAGGAAWAGTSNSTAGTSCGGAHAPCTPHCSASSPPTQALLGNSRTCTRTTRTRTTTCRSHHTGVLGTTLTGRTCAPTASVSVPSARLCLRYRRSPTPPLKSHARQTTQWQRPPLQWHPLFAVWQQRCRCNPPYIGH